MGQNYTDTRRIPDIRWQLFDALKTGRDTWGLKDRTLAVLHALLSFLPRGDRTSFVVFPSNRCLSERLMGMPESTLRRHLAQLISAGLIARKASPNGKRYRIARDVAYGFDLSPFFTNGSEIRQAARATETDREERAILRGRIREAMQSLTDDSLFQRIAKTLRRKLTLEHLRRLWTDLQNAMPPKRTVSDAQNERHIDSSTEDKRTAADALQQIEGLTAVQITTEEDLSRAGQGLAKSHGLLPAWDYAVKRHGIAWSAFCLLYVLPRIGRIDRPGPYMKALCNRALQGRFNILSALRRGPYDTLKGL